MQVLMAIELVHALKDSPVPEFIQVGDDFQKGLI
jgi:hypothetical protein